MRRRDFLPLLATPALRGQGGGPLRVLLVTGGHDYGNAFHRVLDDHRWEVTVNPHPSAFRSEGFLRSCDVLLLYDMIAELEPEKQNRLRKFFEAGKGIVVLHHALCGHQSWPWYEEAVGGKYLQQPEGQHPKSTYEHDLDLNVRIMSRHPVTEGLPEQFTINDEAYKGFRHAKSNQVLLATDHPQAEGPLAWVSAYPSSRVVYIQLGHGDRAYRDDNFRKLLHNAILWTGSRKDASLSSAL